MSLLHLSILIKIISASFYLMSAILWKKILTEGRVNYQLIFYRTIASILFVSLAYPLLLSLGVDTTNWIKPLYSISISEWITSIAICMFSFWGLYYFTSALKAGRISLVQSLTVTSSLFSFLAAVIIYNEIISPLKWVAIVAIVLGYLYHQSTSFRNIKLTKEIVFIALSSLVWGVSFVLYLIPIKIFGVLYFTLLLEICVLLSSFLLILIKDKKTSPPLLDRQTLSICILIGLMVAGGSIFSHLALSQIPVSINILVGLLFEIVVILYGITKLKEKLLFKDWILIFIITICSILTLI